MSAPVRKQPQRSCIGCRAVKNKRDLIRLVHTPDGRYRLDASGKVSGRGAYLCPTLECLTTAIKRKGFDRAFRTTVPAETARELEAQMRHWLAGGPESPGLEQAATPPAPPLLVPPPASSRVTAEPTFP